MNEVPELLLIDKPAGITSMDVIRRLRKQYSNQEGIFGTVLDEMPGVNEAFDQGVVTATAREKTNAATQQFAKKAPKMGHAGTLDPLANGLMLIGVGPGTKKLTELIKLDKEYIAEVRIGESRTTGDLEGEIIEEKSAESLTAEAVRKELETMVGILRLPVSAYSAIKKEGVPMYKRARAAEKTGDVVTEVPVRDMEVQAVELLDFTAGERAVATVRFVVGSGTYIRSLGEELGKRLGYPATLQGLRRTQVGEYRIEDALEL